MYLKMNIPRVTNAIIFLIVLFIAVYPATAQQMGRVQITSLNAKGGIVPFIDVVVEGEQIKRNLETVGIGEEYENGGLIELPVGVYHVTSRNGNYYPFRRAAFRVEAGKTLHINVFPPIRVLMQALIVDERGARDEYDFAPPLKYDTFNIPSSAEPLLDLLIRYEKKREHKAATEYTGSRLDGGVMVSYNNIAIYANKVRFNQKEMKLEAIGKIVFEDGRRRTRAHRLIMSLNGEAPVVIAR